MVDKINIDLDEAFLNKFFGLTDRVLPPDQEITLLMLRRQLEEIEETIVEAKLAVQQKSNSPAKTAAPVKMSNAFDDGFSSEDTFNLPKKTILIIDDLGVITYQLSVLFQQYNFEVITSKEIYDAIEKFKKQSFDLVVMDLFIPTEREGFILLEELKKITMGNQKPAKIGVMSASAKKEHKQICKMKGAEFYIEKIDDWQKDLLTMVKQM